MGARGVLRTVQGGRLSFWCPGCIETHMVRVEGQERPRWGFNGNYDRPTFAPSVLVRGTYSEPPVTPENIDEWRRSPWPQQKVERVCHSFIRDGQIQFLSDCTHALAGQTVALEPFDGT